MKTRLAFFDPSPVLSPFVKKYYLFEGPNDGTVHQIPPWTKPVLALQCGGEIHVTVGEPGKAKPASINGIVTKPYSLLSRESYLRFFAIEFTQIGLSTLFRESGKSFIDASVDIFDIIPARKRTELTEAVAETNDINKKVRIVESLLNSLLPSNKEMFRMRTVINTLFLINANKGKVEIEEVAKTLGFTSKHIRQSFKQAIGVSPKFYSQLIRFNGVFNATMDGNNYSYKYPEFDSFYDQAHFIKQFKTLTGYTPSVIPKERFAFARIFTSI